MKNSLRIFFAGLLIFLVSESYGQQITRVRNPSVVCLASPENIATHVDAPQAFKNRSASRATTADIEVVYTGFSVQAQAAFQYAVDIWASLISSPVKIRISATWTPLGAGVLGSCGPAFYARNFDGAPSVNIDYPGALAEKLAGKELNGSDEFDLVAQFSSTFSWYYNSTGTPAVGQYDLISVVLHEIGHGLGFTDAYYYEAGLGGTSGPVPYDVNLENLTGLNLYRDFVSPSTQLGSQLVSNNLYIESPLAVAGNNGQRPRIYAPATWSSGSSIAHLDESTYPAGNANSLMSPQIAAREVVHDPGVITLSLFKDLGWTTTYIDHEPIASTESGTGPFNVIATVTPDNTPDYDIEAGTVYLHYFTSDNSAHSDTLSIAMTATGNPNEYSAQLPASGGNAIDYFYYISVDDNLDRTLTKPGKVYTALEQAVQGFYTFHVGPDEEPPVLTHTAKEYLSFLESTLKLTVEVVDRNPLSSVEVEHSVAGVAQSNVSMTLLDDKTEFNPLTGLTKWYYETTIPLASLADGDELVYRIVATDNTSNSNIGVAPEDDFYHLPFIGAKQSQESYVNNFNIESDDFFGDEGDFSISQPDGFNDPAIHSVHPYVEASSLALSSINYIYTLKVPILVQEIGATVKFDEIVLVEPGEPGAPFPDPEFYDYVVVEATTDGGTTWTPVADGYDSRDYSPWLTRYNSATSGTNSTAVGDPSLYRTRKFNLLDKFNPGDEIFIRFRLYSDAGAAGWGWAIDNLRIQIDDEAPVVLHAHIDYLQVGADLLAVDAKVADDVTVDKITLEIGVNEQPTQLVEEEVGVAGTDVSFNVELPDLGEGDVIHYRLISTDPSGNSITIPAVGYFETPVIEFDTPVTQYTNDFNTASQDFVGNFFGIAEVEGFSNGAIHSTHDYLTGFGPDSISTFTYTLKKPIVVSELNPSISFDEVVLVQGHAGGVKFDNPAFNDYVIVEGSGDGGITWKKFFDGYDIVGQSSWVSAFNNNKPGSSALFKTRTFNMTSSGDFSAGDEVIIRFRMLSDGTINGWGWAIDNLHIQDAVITATGEESELTLSIYPNPAKEKITVEAKGLTAARYSIQLMNLQGQVVYNSFAKAENGKILHSISAEALNSGLYLVKVSKEGKAVTQKIVKH